jgi:hypothetical protein
MTIDEARNLPVFEGFGMKEIEVNGVLIRVPVQSPRSVGAFWVDETTPLTWQDPDGTWWRLGRYLDGEWFKRPC